MDKQDNKPDVKDSIFKICRSCEDYLLCCEIGRCGSSDEGCYREYKSDLISNGSVSV